MKYRVQFDEKYKGNAGVITGGLSCVVPDQTLTVRELMDRHTRRIGAEVKVYPDEYFDDEEIPVIQDPVDLMEYKEFIKEREEEVNARINGDYEEYKKKKKEQEERNYLRWKKERENDSEPTV